MKKFTLIELLVVIGIIGILASILVPSLSSAKASAEGSKCLSNLKQCATALAQYSATYKGEFPMSEVPSWSGAKRGTIAYLAGMKHAGVYTPSSSFKPPKFLTSYDVIICPNNPQASDADFMATFKNKYWANNDCPPYHYASRWVHDSKSKKVYKRGYFYGRNMDAWQTNNRNEQGKFPNVLKSDKAYRPSDLFYFADDLRYGGETYLETKSGLCHCSNLATKNPGVENMADVPKGGLSWLYASHGKGVNLTFVDSHAEAVLPGDKRISEGGLEGGGQYVDQNLNVMDWNQ